MAEFPTKSVCPQLLPLNKILATPLIAITSSSICLYRIEIIYKAMYCVSYSLCIRCTGIFDYKDISISIAHVQILYNYARLWHFNNGQTFDDSMTSFTCDSAAFLNCKLSSSYNNALHNVFYLSSFPSSVFFQFSFWPYYISWKRGYSQSFLDYHSHECAQEKVSLCFPLRHAELNPQPSILTRGYCSVSNVGCCILKHHYHGYR